MIPLFRVHMTDDAIHRASNVLGSGFIGQGPIVDAFEEEFNKIAPAPIVATNSCTSAIHMVLSHLGIGPGDEVITTPLTCVASNAPILAVGARPVWADVRADDGNINPYDVGSKITKRTKAIIAVNWTGRAPDYEGLKSYGLPVIEDAAHGPLVGIRPTGDFICYSFGPIKHLTSGDGGAVGHRDPEVRDALRLMRWYGLDRRSKQDFRCAQDITLPGLKWHMTDLNAAIGLANLHTLPNVVERHQRNAARLYGMLSDYWTMPQFDRESNYWVFPVVCDSLVEREKLKEYLTTNGVMASQVHARNDHHTAYWFPNGDLPGLDAFDETHLNIPCGWWLSEADLMRIIDLMIKFRRS